MEETRTEKSIKNVVTGIIYKIVGILFPFLITSINLQNKTIESSKKQLEQRLNFKYEEKDNNVINPKVGIINNLNSLKNDLYNYSLSDNTLVSRPKSRIKIKK